MHEGDVSIYVNTSINTSVAKSRFTVVHVEKDMQVMIITIAFLTQKNVTTINLFLPTPVLLHFLLFTSTLPTTPPSLCALQCSLGLIIILLRALSCCGVCVC